MVLHYTSTSLKPILHRLGFHELPCINVSRVSTHFHLRKLKCSPLNHNLSRLACSSNSNTNSSGFLDSLNINPDFEDPREKNEGMRGSLTTNGTLEKLKRYGISGVLSYGLLNTAYYLTTFLVVWSRTSAIKVSPLHLLAGLYVAPAPGKMGYFAAAERFVKVMAMVWAGSQVTKLIRAGGALALAPLVDRGLSWFTVKFKFASKGKAFMTIVGFCFGLAILLFLVMTLLWA